MTTSKKETSAHTHRQTTIANNSGRCHASTKRPVSSLRGKKTRNRSIVIGRVVQPTKRQMKKTRVEALIGDVGGVW